MLIDYEIIEKIFTEVWTNRRFVNVHYSLKGAAILFVLVRFGVQIYQNYSQLGGGGTRSVITARGIAWVLLLVTMVAFYDWFLVKMDQALSVFFAYFNAFDSNTISIDVKREQAPDLSGSGPLAVLKEYALLFLEYLENPALILSDIILWIAWLFDWIIFGLFIGQRFFVLLLLKLTGPLVIVFSLLPKLQGWFYNWLRLYVTWYLLIIPYMLANLIINGFLESIDQIRAQEALTGELIFNPVIAPLSIFVVLLKFVLYSTGKKLYEQIITIDRNEELQ
jgi:hypothetical protein